METVFVKLVTILFALFGIYLLAISVPICLPFLRENRHKSWHIVLTGFSYFGFIVAIFGALAFHWFVEYPLASAAWSFFSLICGIVGTQFLQRDSADRRKLDQQSIKKEPFKF